MGIYVSPYIMYARNSLQMLPENHIAGALEHGEHPLTVSLFGLSIRILSHTAVRRGPVFIQNPHLCPPSQLWARNLPQGRLCTTYRDSKVLKI